MQCVDRFQDYVSKSDDVQESLEKLGVSNERLSSMVAAEAKALSVSLDVEASKMPSISTARTSLGIKMHALLQKVDSPAQAIEHCLSALGVLDIYCLQRPDALERDSHWSLAVALVAIELKTNAMARRVVGYDDMEVSIPDMILQVMYAANQWLDRACLPRLQSVDVLRQEQTILTFIHWRARVPTANDWIALIGARLDTLTRSLLSSSIGMIRDYCSRWAFFLASTYRTTAELSPRVVANGLICLSCVASGVLPPGVFAPIEIDSIPDMFKCYQCPRIAKLTDDEGVVFVAALIAATGSDFPSLQNDTDIVNDALADLSQNRVQFHLIGPEV